MDKNSEDKKLDEKAKARLERELNNEYTLKLKKRDWLVIYNILTSLSYKLGDARIVNSIVERVQAIAALDARTADKVLTN